MPPLPETVKGPFILWLFYGPEGWQPHSFDTLEQALAEPKHVTIWTITRPVKFKVVDENVG